MDKFFSEVAKPGPRDRANDTGAEQKNEAPSEERKALPKGVVLGKDGKP